MADYSRAAEIRSSGPGYTEVGNFRGSAHGDTAGAIASYDQAIPPCLNRKIAGGSERRTTTKLKWTAQDSLYYQRGCAKELKGDILTELNPD